MMKITAYESSSLMRGISIFAIIARCLCCNFLLLGATPPSSGEHFRLALRTEVQAFKARSSWQKAQFEQDFSKHETAVVICDMWDRHWCTDANLRVGEIARRMEPVLQAARSAGILIIHSPSDTMEFYKDYPQRRIMLSMPRAEPPPSLGLTAPPLPIDDSDGGCQTPGDLEHQAWTRENPILSIAPNDVISDNGEEIYSLLRQRGIKNLFLMGVHANMCVLNRTFAIKQMSNWGISCVLVRDLTDSMYNPKSRPFVSHAAGTELVIDYIESYWCPSTLSVDFVRSLK
jgi:nicotinamidase-related amidase